VDELFNDYREPLDIPLEGGRTRTNDREYVDFDKYRDYRDKEFSDWDVFQDKMSKFGRGVGKTFSKAGEAIGDRWDEMSQAEKARTAYAMSKGVQSMFPSKAEQDVNRLNLIAKNLGYAGQAKIEKGTGIDDRMYQLALAKQAEDKQKKRDENETKYLKMLEAYYRSKAGK